MVCFMADMTPVGWTIVVQHGCSSVTDNGVGDGTVTLTYAYKTSFPPSTFHGRPSASTNNVGAGIKRATTPTATSVNIWAGSGSGGATATDLTRIGMLIIGDN